MKQAVVITIIALLLVTLFANSQTKMSRKEYIDTYKHIAVSEMHRSGVPASITMAQGCLESHNGNSKLAKRSNNHFGIKCKKSWKGPKTFHDDDKLRECFRVYSTVEASYIDHSDFLLENPRYSKLFEIDIKNYKAWARGLKRAGYATDPKYANRLISIIEAEDLWRLDKIGPGVLPEPQKKEKKKLAIDAENASKKIKDAFDKYTIDPTPHRAVMVKNRIECIEVKEGDTFESIARELDMKTWEIRHYNDYEKDDPIPNAGTFLYIERKRYSAPRGNKTYKVKGGQSMHEISQMFGIKLSSLYRKNRIEKGTKPRTGEIIYLRGRKPRN